MAVKKDFWHEQWNATSDPQTQLDEAAFDLSVREYRCLIDQRPYRSVLEFGCGSGDFYERLGFDRCDCHGVDFSQGMIEAFRARHPQARLETADIRSYKPDRRYDLIVSTGLVQYLSAGIVDAHLGNVTKKLNPGGQILHLTVPWNAARWQFYSGAMASREPSLFRKLKGGVGALTEIVGLRPKMGRWHSMPQLRRVAAAHGLEAKFYGSLIHPYRFHVRFARAES